MVFDIRCGLHKNIVNHMKFTGTLLNITKRETLDSKHLGHPCQDKFKESQLIEAE